MKDTGTISMMHVILLSMTFIGLKNHVTIIPSILIAAGRDGWLSVILGAFVTFIWLFLLVYIHKKSKQEPIREWLKQRIGKVGSAIVLYSTAFYLMLLAAFTMRETLLWISTTFLIRTPTLILLVIYTILVIYLVSSNLQVIAIVNVFVLTAVIIFGFFVAFVNVQWKDYELLRPFLEHGFQPVIKGMVYPISGYVEILLILFIQHKVQGRIRWYHFAIILLLLMWLTTGPLIGAISEFGPIEAAKQRYTAYEEWGLATIGRYIEHVDFLSIYQWLTGAFIRMSLLLYVCSDILNIAGEKKQVWSKIAPPFLFICLSLILIRDNLFTSINKHEFLFVTIIYFVLLSLFLAIIAFVSRKSSTISTDSNNKKSGEEQSNQVKSP